MKNFVLAMLFMGLTMYLGYELYERSKGFSWGNSDEESEDSSRLRSLPAYLQIESVDGRKLQIQLIAMTHRDIQFERLSDGEMFVYPLNQLTSASKELLSAYEYVPIVATDELLRQGGVTLEEVYVQRLKDEITRIDRELSQLRREYSATQSTIERRTIRRKSEELEAERAGYQEEIDQRSI